MKKFTLPVLFIIISIAQLACTNNPGSGEIYSSVLSSNPTKSKIAEKDVRVLVDMYASGLYKISLANEAEIRSISPEAIQLAKNLNAFQSNINSKIEVAASEHGFELPMDLTNDQKQQWKDLVKEKGWDFDKRFSAMVETLLQQEEVLFAAVSKNNADEELTNLANAALPQFENHQTLIQALNEKIKAKTEVIVEEDEKQKTKGGTKTNVSKNIISAK